MNEVFELRKEIERLKQIIAALQEQIEYLQDSNASLRGF